MAVLFRRLTEHMQRFDALFSSALLKSKIFIYHTRLFTFQLPSLA